MFLDLIGSSGVFFFRAIGASKTVVCASTGGGPWGPPQLVDAHAMGVGELFVPLEGVRSVCHVFLLCGRPCKGLVTLEPK